jgi:hypothetical protein
MSFEKIGERRTWLENRINKIDDMISNSYSYKLDINKIKELKEEREKLFLEYSSLPPQEIIDEPLYLRTDIRYIDDSDYMIKQTKDGKWMLQYGSEYYGEAEFENGKPIRVSRIMQNSETKGRKIKLIIPIKIDEKEPVEPHIPTKVVVPEFWNCNRCRRNVDVRTSICPQCGNSKVSNQK